MLPGTFRSNRSAPCCALSNVSRTPSGASGTATACWWLGLSGRIIAGVWTDGRSRSAIGWCRGSYGSPWGSAGLGSPARPRPQNPHMDLLNHALRAGHELAPPGNGATWHLAGRRRRRVRLAVLEASARRARVRKGSRRVLVTEDSTPPRAACHAAPSDIGAGPLTRGCWRWWCSTRHVAPTAARAAFWRRRRPKLKAAGRHGSARRAPPGSFVMPRTSATPSEALKAGSPRSTSRPWRAPD